MIRGLISGVLGSGSGSSSATVTPFTYQPETDTAAAAMVAAGGTVSTKRKRTINRMIQRLKSNGVWNKVTHLYLLCAADQASSLINVRNPGTNNLTVVGTPTFAANVGWNATAGTSGNGLSTGIPVTTLSPGISFGMWAPMKTIGGGNLAGADLGAAGAANGSGGLFLNMFNEGAFCSSRYFTASGINSTKQFTAGGFCGVAGDALGNIRYNGCGTDRHVTTGTLVTPTQANNLTLLYAPGIGVNATGRVMTAFFLGNALTEWDTRQLYSCVQEYVEKATYGEPIEELPGTGSEIINADVVVYGTTFCGITAAFEAARQGKTVALVGGWRDRRLGGMSSGGLGWTDFDNHAGLGSVPRVVISQINAWYGRADTTFSFEPFMFWRVMHQLCDSARNGGRNIPVYYTKGVTTVTKEGTVLKGFRTADGRVVIGKQFVDASYEGDLLKLAGVSYTSGREAASGSFAQAEYLNGFMGKRGNNAYSPFFRTAPGARYDIDPYVVPGVPSSGRIAGVGPRTYGVDTPAEGSADNHVQAYNFRLILLTDGRAAPWSVTPPPGYSKAKYEMLVRYFAQCSDCVRADLFYNNLLTPAGAWDFNHNNGQSTDYIGMSAAYPEASYSQREAIWKDHWNYIQGLFYFLQYESGTNINTALRNDMLNWGKDAYHYIGGIHENDDVFDTPQLYVREARRMVSDMVWTGLDISATDGTTPRSTNIISVASYNMDSHYTETYVDPNGGSPRIMHTGTMQFGIVGDKLCPIPYEIYVPKRSECTNLYVPFCVSSTHVAFGSIRMEYTAAMAGQSLGLAACLAIDNACACQDVPYATLRGILTNASRPDFLGPAQGWAQEVAAVLPQVN